MKRYLALIALLVTYHAQADEVTLNNGDTLDWATTPLTGKDVLTANGGTILNLSGRVECRINVGGEVTVYAAQGATPRLACKVVKTDVSGKLVFNGSVEVGGPNGNYPFIDNGVIAFADSTTDAKVIFAASSYTTSRLMPQYWNLPVQYGSTTIEIPFSPVPTGTTEVRIPAPDTGSGRHTLRVVSPEILPQGTTVIVPENAVCNIQPMTLNETTYGSSTTDNTTVQTFKHNVELSGGTYQIGAHVPVTIAGNFSGAGDILVNGYANKTTVRARNFTGSLTGMTDESTFTVADPEDAGANKNNYAARVTSDFPGTVIVGGTSSTNIVSFGVSDLKNTKQVTLSFGAIKSTGKVFPVGNETAYGALLQFNQNQKWVVGSLAGELTISPSQTSPCAMSVGTIEDNANIYIRYGLDLTVGTVGKNVKIHYLPVSNKQPNALTVTGSAAFAEIEIQGTANTVQFNNVAADLVSGGGKIEVVGGACRFGKVDDAIAVDVQAGSVNFGVLKCLQEVLSAKSPSLWLDASATSRMEGPWNATWAKTAPAGQKTTFNGKNSAAYAGHPLIEKWLDKRDDGEHDKTYGWQYRNYGYDKTLYTLVYPYLVENGLNGKPYMSFGTLGEEMDTATYGTGGANTTEASTYKQERRRMPFMEGLTKEGNFTGHGVQVATAVMVFGSQNGGGRAVLGGYQSTSTSIPESPNGRKTGDKGILDKDNDPPCSLNFPRGGTIEETKASTPIFSTAKKLDTWLDGVSVDPTTEGFNGGWQILSFNDPSRNYARSLGMSNRYAFAGGQNYAEIMLFGSVLADDERQAVEEYLAAKWGLTVPSKRTGSVTVAPGALVSGLVADVSGGGTVLTKTGEGYELTGSLNLVSTGDKLTPTLTGYAELKLPSELTVNVDMTTRLKEGVYEIASADKLTGAETIVVKVSPDKYSCKVAKDGNVIKLTVRPHGLVILIK